MPLDAARRGARRRSFAPDPAKRRDIAQEITNEIIALLEIRLNHPPSAPARAKTPVDRRGVPTPIDVVSH